MIAEGEQQHAGTQVVAIIEPVESTVEGVGIVGLVEEVGGGEAELQPRMAVADAGVGEEALHLFTLSYLVHGVLQSPVELPPLVDLPES